MQLSAAHVRTPSERIQLNAAKQAGWVCSARPHPQQGYLSHSSKKTPYKSCVTCKSCSYLWKSQGSEKRNRFSGKVMLQINLCQSNCREFTKTKTAERGIQPWELRKRQSESENEKTNVDTSKNSAEVTGWWLTFPLIFRAWTESISASDSTERSWIIRKMQIKMIFCHY